MPFDTTTPWGSLESAALAYAASLDAAFAASPGEALEEALLAVGELLGGLSMHGFARDLQSHLERVEEDIVMDANPRDYSPGLGPNDPDGVFSARLSGAIARAREDDAAFWMIAARKVIAQHTPAALAVAA